EVYRNTFKTELAKEGTVTIYNEDSIMMASILEDYTNGGNTFKDNVINGGKVGIIIRQHYAEDSFPSTFDGNIISNTDIGTQIDIERPAFNTPIYLLNTIY